VLCSSHLICYYWCIAWIIWWPPMLCSVHISAPTNRLPATLVRSELPVLSSLLISFSLNYMWVPPIITHLYSLLFFFLYYHPCWLASLSLTCRSHLSSPTSTPCSSSSGSLHRRPAKSRDVYDVENTCIKPINSLEEPRLISNIIQPRLQSVLCYSTDRKIKDAWPVATIEHI